MFFGDMVWLGFVDEGIFFFIKYKDMGIYLRDLIWFEFKINLVLYFILIYFDILLGKYL